MNREDFTLKNIYEHCVSDSQNEVLLFTGPEHEVLVLPYNFGHPAIFMRNVKLNEQFMEVVGGWIFITRKKTILVASECIF
jgi:hypothetical protein